MELVGLYKRVIGLDIHQAQITACALIEEPTAAHASSNGNLADSSGIAGNWPIGSPRCVPTKL